jgi:hemoglobin
LKIKYSLSQNPLIIKPGEKTMPLYEKLGGDTAINAAVDIFYRQVLADDRISQFFESTDMEAQHAKQEAFMTMAFGGPNNYTGKDMREAHKHMNLTNEHFNAVAENLVATLNELDVAQELIDEVVTIVSGAKDDILNK